MIDNTSLKLQSHRLHHTQESPHFATIQQAKLETIDSMLNELKILLQQIGSHD